MFINRIHELEIFDKFLKDGNFIALWGRRRLGKTSLIKHFFQQKNALYIQAIEGETRIQIAQMKPMFPH